MYTLSLSYHNPVALCISVGPVLSHGVHLFGEDLILPLVQQNCLSLPDRSLLVVNMLVYFILTEVSTQLVNLFNICTDHYSE